jgi:hypothetical protein
MSSYNGDNLPVIIGIGQSVHHPEDIAYLKKPVELIELAISRAVEDLGFRTCFHRLIPFSL